MPSSGDYMGFGARTTEWASMDAHPLYCRLLQNAAAFFSRAGFEH
jgi:hypothetical protein